MTALVTPTLRAGDILMYYNDKDPTIIEDAVVFGEELRDGRQKRMYYHCAIVVNSNEKIEANGNIPISKRAIIYDGSFDVFRVPLPLINGAITWLYSVLGETYDWWLDINFAIEYLTWKGPKWLGMPWHLPRKFLERKERKEKICSSLVIRFLKRGGFRTKLDNLSNPVEVSRAIDPYLFFTDGHYV